MSAADKAFQVVGIGNALVDVLAHVEEDFLVRHLVSRGIMQLIGLERARELYGLMGTSKEACGGSVANTIAGLTMLGNRAAYIGKVKDDHLGRVFAKDMDQLGAVYTTDLAPASSNFETGRSMVLVTPDGERSMNTYLGAAERLTTEDVNAELVSDTEWIYLEGFRFDGPDSQEAFRKASEICRSNGGRVALALSDPFCVERHRVEFGRLIRGGVNLLLCNKSELLSLYETESLETAVESATREVELLACTLSDKGALAACSGEEIRIPAFETNVVDATGAGDLFASGFLHGITAGQDLETSLKLGCAAAAEVICHVGARPSKRLRTSLAKRGFHLHSVNSPLPRQAH